jgi:hypothetical protein
MRDAGTARPSRRMDLEFRWGVRFVRVGLGLDLSGGFPQTSHRSPISCPTKSCSTDVSNASWSVLAGTNASRSV